MARALTATESRLSVQAPRRVGRYDRWLDGSLWELSLKDFKGRFKVRKASKVWRHARRAVKARARVRGIGVRVERLSDGTLVVQAWRKQDV